MGRAWWFDACELEGARLACWVRGNRYRDIVVNFVGNQKGQEREGVRKERQGRKPRQQCQLRCIETKCLEVRIRCRHNPRATAGSRRNVSPCVTSQEVHILAVQQ